MVLGPISSDYQGVAINSTGGLKISKSLVCTFCNHLSSGDKIMWWSTPKNLFFYILSGRSAGYEPIVSDDSCDCCKQLRILSSRRNATQRDSVCLRTSQNPRYGKVPKRHCHCHSKRRMGGHGQDFTHPSFGMTIAFLNFTMLAFKIIFSNILCYT